MRHYDLATRFDSRASFYGKARVIIREGVVELHSYTTHVATVSNGGQTAEVYGAYSNTTLRHVKEFLLQEGFKADNSKQIMADYGVAK